ncbi:N-acetyltransferase [uncultured Alistipes sp.]|uniref:GNAT family N-acetyltransferase n=1 Tax=uncultured Alistipes sp. TaxID=538949 RepID=UPI0026339407|nr:N-acetyltransferase [uncultured Alistipes sp.]
MAAEIIIREMLPDEYGVLKDFLYEAIFIPEGTPAPPREVVNHPSLRRYYDTFGSERTDVALCAVQNTQIVGAIWCRCMEGYGHVADGIPELAMAVKTPFRSRGIGKQLLLKMIDLLQSRGCGQISLSVQKINFAYDLYRKAGFQTVRETEEEYIMVYPF